MTGTVAEHDERIAARIEGTFAPLFALVEHWRTAVQDEFRTFAAQGVAPTAAVLDPFMEELARPALMAPAGLITGSGFVATPGVLSDAPWHLAWWLREIHGLDRGDRGGVRRLEAVNDPDSVPVAIATVLGVTPQGDTPLVQSVAETLAGRQILLVVDNCEHVLAAAVSTVTTILGLSGHVRIIATSREAFAINDEVALPIPPLACVGGVASDAATLFIDRARAVRPDFGINDPQTAEAVTEICETLDGFPLGIELAAARMAAMSAVEVRDRLADRFRLLQGGQPGPERQMTLRHAVEWSYDLLTDASFRKAVCKEFQTSVPGKC